MSARKPFTFTATPAARTSSETLRVRGYKLGDTVWTSDVNTDGSLRPDGDREVYVFADALATSSGVYALASTLSPRVEQLTPGSYKIVAEPTYHLDGLPRTFRGRTLAPKIGDTVVVTGPAGASYGDDVKASGLSSGWRISAACLAPAPVAEPTLAERFPVGRLVVTTADPKTADGGYVSHEFRGVVAQVKGTTFGDVRLALPNGERPFLTNIVGPEHLTLLPEGVLLVKPTVREPLSFTDAYAKAVAHRGEPTSAKQVAKASKLAELLIEVSK